MPRATRLHLAALAVVAGLLLGSPAGAAAATPEFFKLPEGVGTGNGLAVEPDGDLWFPANTNSGPTPGIGRLIASEATPGTDNGISVYPTPKPSPEPNKYPCCANYVRSVAFDAAHNRVWFVQDEGVVGYAETQAVVPGTTDGMNAMRTELNDMYDVAFAPSTNLAWFTEHDSGNTPPYGGDRIASIDESLHIHELPNLAIQNGGDPVEPEFEDRYDSEPSGIALDSSGKPWFAEESTDDGWRIGTAPAGGEKGPYTEYELESCPALDGCDAPTDTAVAPDGSVWFTTTDNEVGRLNATHTEIEKFSMASIDPEFSERLAAHITAAPDGTIWVSESGFYGHSLANALVRIVPSAVPTTTVYPLGANAPYALAADTKGNIWFSAAAEVGDSSELGRLPGVVGTSLVGEITPIGGTETPPTGNGTTTLTGTSTTTTPTTSPTEKPLIPLSRGTATISPPIPKGSSVTSEQICIGPPSQPCAVVYLLSAGEYVTGFPGTKASVAKKRGGVVLGRTAVTLHGGQRKKITVKLNAAGMRELKQKHSLVVYFTATQAGLGSSPPQLLKRVKIVLHYHP
jgi:streptogramin lyase